MAILFTINKPAKAVDKVYDALKVGEDVKDLSKKVDKSKSKPKLTEPTAGDNIGNALRDTGTSNIIKNGTTVFKKFDVSNAYVKPKHLSTTGGNGAKFLGSTKAEAEEILRQAMRNGDISEVLDNGLTKQGKQSYEIIINAGKQIGTRGEQRIKIILSVDGGMLSAYPIK